MRIRLLIPAAAALCALAACKDQKEIEITEQDCAYMREAIRLASESVENGGGPFGAVIVKDGKIIAGRSNSVTIDYGNSRKDAAKIDFDDDLIYDELDTPMSRRTIPIIPLLRDEALESFRLWSEKTDKTEY